MYTIRRGDTWFASSKPASIFAFKKEKHAVFVCKNIVKAREIEFEKLEVGGNIVRAKILHNHTSGFMQEDMYVSMQNSSELALMSTINNVDISIVSDIDYFNGGFDMEVECILKRYYVDGNIQRSYLESLFSL